MYQISSVHSFFFNDESLYLNEIIISYFFWSFDFVSRKKNGSIYYRWTSRSFFPIWWNVNVLELCFKIIVLVKVLSGFSFLSIMIASASRKLKNLMPKTHIILIWKNPSCCRNLSLLHISRSRILWWTRSCQLGAEEEYYHTDFAILSVAYPKDIDVFTWCRAGQKIHGLIFINWFQYFCKFKLCDVSPQISWDKKMKVPWITTQIVDSRLRAFQWLADRYRVDKYNRE